MKKSLLVIVSVFLIVHSSYSQNVFDPILDLTPETTERVDRNPDEFHKVYLPMPYGSEVLTDTSALKELRAAAVYRIDLVYTRYKGSERFSQRKLNHKRLVKLHQLFPHFLTNTAIEWHLIEESEEEVKERAQQLYHGFVFYVRGSRIKENGELRKMITEDEIAYIKAKLTLDSLEKEIDSKTGIKRTEHVTWKTVPAGRKYIPWSKKKRAKGILYNRRTILRRRPKDIMDSVRLSEIVWDSTGYLGCKYRLDRCRTDLDRYRFDPITASGIQSDTIVKKVLNYYTHQQVVVVEDVTGSMFPYITQTFAWRRLHVLNTGIDRFTFFNDGDNHPDGPIGKSGGAYHVVSDSIAPIEDEAFATMRKGGGGSCPENNMESVLHTVDEFGEKERILMIADNWANVRDLTLLKQLAETGVVVDVILCGAAGRGVNRDYLQIVRQTGGTIYTMEAELSNLAAMHEGETFKIGIQQFVVRGGEILIKH